MKITLSKEQLEEIQKNKNQAVFGYIPALTKEEIEEIQKKVDWDISAELLPAPSEIVASFEAGSKLIVRAKDKFGKEALWFIENNLIGFGLNGNIYPAYPINLEGEVDFSVQYVVKVLPIKKEGQKEKIQNEADNMSQLYRTMQPVFYEDKAYIVTQKLSGKAMEHMQSTLEQLSFSEKITLIKEICFDFQRMNRNFSIEHGDLHEGQILIEDLNQEEFRKESKKSEYNKYNKYKYNVSILDFGKSSIYQSEDESYSNTKDIPSLGHIFKALLKQEHSKSNSSTITYEEKENLDENKVIVVEKEEGAESLPDDVQLLKKTEAFIEEKMLVSYPTLDEVLNFFVALDNLLMVKKVLEEDEKLSKNDKNKLSEEVREEYKKDIKNYIKRIENPENDSSRKDVKIEEETEKNKEEKVKNTPDLKKAGGYFDTLYRFFSHLKSESSDENKEEKKTLLKKKLK